MSLLNKHFWKFFVGLLAVVILVFLAIYGVDYYSNYKIYSQERANERYVKDLAKQYMEDTYGGKTPEETLALFIDALKKGDTDLAAKYFVIDEQEKWRGNLLTIKETGKLPIMLRDAQKLSNKYPLTDGRNDRFIFEAFNADKELILQADLSRASNGLWKILEL